MLTRRQFVRGSAATVFTLAACQSVPRPRARSANEEIRCAVIGLRGRGKDLVDGLRRQPNVAVVALCDVDEQVLADEVARLGGAEVPVVGLDTYRDARAVFDRKDIDVVAIATPNHWHALLAIWACQAGKDVYVEKPVSHNIWEGRQVVRAARHYHRIVQAGTQCRSADGIAAGIEFIQSGGLGKIQLARGLCYKPRKSIGKVSAPQVVPASIDYDLWCGPALKVPLARQNLHYDWHWDWNTGNGDLGNQGIHQMDIARWALGEKRLAPRVISVGGRLGYEDDGRTPNTQFVFHDYERAPLIFEVRGLPRDSAEQAAAWTMDEYNGTRIGVLVQCEQGSLRIPTYERAEAFDRDGNPLQSWQLARDHMANFIECVRSRRVEDLSADIEEGHVSSALCHAGNVSYALGRKMPPGEALERLRSEPEALETFERMQGHLERNGVDLERTPLTVGPWLRFDPKHERFHDAAANGLLAREYREPFVVPERV